MCAGAMVLARIERLAFGTADPKAGFAGSLGDLVRDQRLNHRIEVSTGVLEDECAEVLRAFFRDRR
jgi:tRNA(adenine34) deaminase